MLGGQEISYISPTGRRTGLALNILHDVESPYARHETYSVNSIYRHYRTGNHLRGMKLRQEASGDISFI